MTRVFNRPEDFAEQAVKGLLRAHPDRLAEAAGGVIRASAPQVPRPALVIGGGSGHYPAFAGLVGPGLADGAVLGNIFASPATQQVLDIVAAVETGRGVILSYGNYAGDTLNFGLAQERLRRAGIDCRTVLVTDDLSSAPKERRDERRGIAGDLVVFKVMGAAVEAGCSIDEIERLGRLANERTSTIGVAFGGCTLPGADAPLFEIPEGRMAVGMGIHGEPGLWEQHIPSSGELAEILLEQILGDLPEGVPQARGQRAAVILNGLGSVKHEELFVLFGDIADALDRHGIEIVQPEVGEYCTSFDMAGLSLTVSWLTPELEGLWAAPADAPAYRKGAAAPAAGSVPVSSAAGRTAGSGDQRRPSSAADVAVEAHAAAAASEADEESRAVAAKLENVFDAIESIIELHAEELGRIDAVAGDGDHGIGMQRGARAAAQAVRRRDPGAGAGTALGLAGAAWAAKAGGTSGVLWGLMLEELGSVLGDTGVVTPETFARAVSAASAALQRAGGAQLGDKTMLDAIIPFADALEENALGRGEDLATAWRSAAREADLAAQATAELVPQRGRSKSHPERSRGTVDAGAHSFALIVNAVAGLLEAGSLE